MNRYLSFITLLTIGTLLFSCKKEIKNNGIVTPQKTYKVNFSVSGSGSSLKQVSGSSQLQSGGSSSLASQFSVLIYNIFDSKNNVVRQLVQQSTDADFGAIDDSLAAGTYTVAIAAGQANLFENEFVPTGSGTINPFCAYFLQNNATGSTIGPFSDTFYAKTSLTISNAPVSLSVQLQRIDAELEIKINDALPANADHFTYSVDNEYLAFDLLTGLPQAPLISPFILNYSAPAPTTVTIPASAVGTAGFTMDHIVLNTSATHTVTFTCYDAQSNVLATRTVSNVTFQANTETILSGNLFGSVNNAVITTPATWGPTSTISF
jgi:hypothetical protein